MIHRVDDYVRSAGLSTDDTAAEYTAGLSCFAAGQQPTGTGLDTPYVRGWMDAAIAAREGEKLAEALLELQRDGRLTSALEAAQRVFAGLAPAKGSKPLTPGRQRLLADAEAQVAAVLSALDRMEAKR